MKTEKAEELKVFIPNDMFEPTAIMELSGKYELGQISANFDTYRLSRPVEYRTTITNTGDGLYISGQAETTATTECSRCLEEVTLDLQGKIEGFVLFEASQVSDIENAEEADSAEDLDILPASHEIDFDKFIIAALVMDLPLQPLCSPDCKGLCPRCGENLNSNECTCKASTNKNNKSSDAANGNANQQDDIDDSNPFAVLKGLKLDD